MRGKCTALDRIWRSLKPTADLQQPRVVEGEPDAEEPLGRVHTVGAHARRDEEGLDGKLCDGRNMVATDSLGKSRL